MTLERGGLIVRLEQGRRFVPASSAKSVLSDITVAPLPGSRFGMGLAEGRILLVLPISQVGTDFVVCEIEGESVALSGLAVIASGVFPSGGNQVHYEDEWVPELDLKELLLNAKRELISKRGSELEKALTV